ncbi:MAG: hypothetical protein BYD32DRAFT_462782 [Podila humilis]|nr:MAG: hypothetical protein BYD32DRAFT_462782 [Podila humilis]
MIFHTPYAVAVIGLFVSLLKLAFSLFAGATLVFYVKYFPDEYANSIRWSRAGGLPSAPWESASSSRQWSLVSTWMEILLSPEPSPRT